MAAKQLKDINNVTFYTSEFDIDGNVVIKPIVKGVDIDELSQREESLMWLARGAEWDRRRIERSRGFWRGLSMTLVCVIVAFIIRWAI